MRFAGCLIALALLAGSPAQAAEFYSVQVRAVPVAEAAAAEDTWRALIDRGYLAYRYRAEIEGKPWIRVAIGVFDSSAAAEDFGKALGAGENLEHFVAAAPVSVTPGEGGEFVVTPDALWTREGGSARRIMAFDDPPPRGFAAPGGIRLKLSPDRRAVAFQYGSRVHIAALGAEKSILVSKGGDSFGDEHDYGPTPYWSPSGRYIAFQDFLEFEVPTSLWIARADGSGLKPLVDNNPPNGPRAVKAFAWHPVEDRLYYVEGATFGGASVGGTIRSIDPDGNTETVATPERPSLQFTGPLEFRNGQLHYRTWELEDGKDSPTIGEGSVKVGDW